MMTRLVAVAALLGSLATPALADDAEPQSLSQEQVATVVKAHMHDIQDCWERLPAKDRASDSNVVLGLSIAPKGSVVDTTIISDAPAETRACIADLTRGWTFPVVELASDIEYSLTLRGAGRVAAR